MLQLRVINNKIVNSKNEEVVLKGANTNSPGILKFEENHDILNDLSEIKKLGFNAVCIPICPAYYQSRANYCELLLDPIVRLSEKLGLYCLIDWHAQGNPIQNITREPSMRIEGYLKYDASNVVAERAAKELSFRYGSNTHVLFNPFSAFLGTNKEEWKQSIDMFTKIIRESTNNIIIISGTDWPPNQTSALNFVIKDQNSVYGMMVYSTTGQKSKDELLKLKAQRPVIITECGYQAKDPKEIALGGTEAYALELKNYIEENRLSWFAWSYHPTRQPTLLNSWDPDDLSPWGLFVKENLLVKK